MVDQNQIRIEHEHDLWSSRNGCETNLQLAIGMVDYLAQQIVGFLPGDTSAAVAAVKREAYEAVKRAH